MNKQTISVSVEGVRREDEERKDYKKVGLLRPGSPPGIPSRAHPLFLQVVSHLLMLTFCQFLIAILVIFSEYGLNFCISMAFPESIERTEVNLLSPWSSPNIKTLECRRKEMYSMLQRDPCFPEWKAFLYQYLGQKQLLISKLTCTVGAPRFYGAALTLSGPVEAHQSLTCPHLAGDSLRCRLQCFF